MSRLSVNINHETHARITQLMKDEGITATEAVRRAFAAYEYIKHHQSKGRTFALLSRRGRIRRMVEFQ